MHTANNCICLGINFIRIKSDIKAVVFIEHLTVNHRHLNILLTAAVNQILHNIEKNLVYSGSKQNVKMTMIGGKVLYQDGEFYLDCPAEVIYERANRFAGEILG